MSLLEERHYLGWIIIAHIKFMKKLKPHVYKTDLIQLRVLRRAWSRVHVAYLKERKKSLKICY